MFFGKLDEPEEIKTEDYRLANKISITLSDEGIKSLSTYWNDRKDKLRPYPECSYCKYCVDGCDYNKRILGREIARRIFVRNFKPDNADSKIVKDVFKQMQMLIQQELNDELFDAYLLACVEMHLLRRIRYGTKINISDATIKVTITNI
jgi:ferredoxin